MPETYAAAHNLTRCASCGAEPDELYCTDEFCRSEPEAWECLRCIRRRHPGIVEPQWELRRSTEEARE